MTLHKMLRLSVLLMGLLALGACDVPRGAALSSEVLREQDAENPSFAVVPVTRANAPQIARWPATGARGPNGWIGGRAGSDSAMIRVGDSISLVIWDSQENSLLTRVAEKAVTLPDLPVSPSGTIFVPYLDEVTVRGLTPAEARRNIQAALEPIVPSAQVQLTVTPGQQNSVDLVSGVVRPGSFPLHDRNTTILSLLAQGGGISTELRNPVVRLIRDGRSYEIRAERLFSEAGRNVVLRGKDKVLVEEDRRYFTALGATGTQQLVYFDKDRITALESLSMIGGLAGSRANPKGVVVLREYPVSAVRADGSGPAMPQVVFTFDLTSADGLFAARGFQINPQDTILATESPVVVARTVLALIGSVFSIASEAQN